MLNLYGNQWTAWARDWGLGHQPQRGVLQKNEAVAGERAGFLIRAGWGEESYPGLTVTIRFPRALDIERVRERLAEDAELDALPGKAAARRGVRVLNAVKPFVRWGTPPEFALTETSLVWRRVFSWGTPKTERIQSWVEALVAAVARATPAFAARCEGCGTAEVKRHVLVDGTPTLLCPSCQQRTLAEGEMAERAYDMTEANHGVGAALAGFAALVGATAWAAVGALTKKEFAAAAIGIGVLVAWAYRRGAGRVDPLGRGISAAFTLASVTLGDILLFAWWVARVRPDIGYTLEAGWYVYLSAWRERPADQVVSLLLAGVGAWIAFKVLERPRLGHTIQQAGEPPVETKRAA